VDAASLLSNPDSVLKREGVKDSIEGYETLFAGARESLGATSTSDSIQHRAKEYQTLVNSFYDLVTDFYEWGWGQSFHFAPRKKGETFDESIIRAEHYLALRANIQQESKVLDVGCGVGGPMISIHHLTGADITGVTLNQYQVRVANQYCTQRGIDDKTRVFQGDFQKLSDQFEAETFDCAYAIEATCHSPDRRVCFKGINHCLKKGGLFACYDWVVLPERGFDSNNPDHLRIKEGIEVGNGLPTLATTEEIVSALEDSGFDVIDVFDANKSVHSDHEIPWYYTLYGSFTLKGFRMTRLGRMCTHALITTLEFLRIAPKGSVRVSSLLNATALDLVEGGRKEIFTPSLFFVARKK
jgi:sterol 24-C-methyltransferase